jgi:hypothetical protein
MDQTRFVSRELLLKIEMHFVDLIIDLQRALCSRLMWLLTGSSFQLLQALDKMRTTECRIIDLYLKFGKFTR